jgi:hypothetical protein
VGARDRDRIGLTALVEKVLALVLPDPELLGNVIGLLRFHLAGVRRFRIAHGVPA